MTSSKFLIPFFIIFLICGCGKETENKQSLSGVSQEPQLGIYSFGAMKCVPCKKFNPQLQAELETQLKEDLTKVRTVLYVVPFGSSEKPNQKTAEEYKQTLHVNFEALPDPDFSIYSQYFGDPGSIPAVAIVDKNGKMLKKFRYEEKSFDSLDVVNFVKS